MLLKPCAEDEDVGVSMQRVRDPRAQIQWLIEASGEADIAGYDAKGWEDSTWILHAIYRNPSLEYLGTWEDHRRRRREGDRTPLVVNGIDLEYGTDESGRATPEVRVPGGGWIRVPWSDYVEVGSGRGSDCGFPPCYRWFGDRDWPVAVQGTAEGTMDEESLRALLEVLASHSSAGADTECFAHVCQLATNDFDNEHLWAGDVRAIPELVEDFGGPYWCTPNNFWTTDRSWFVWTDYDLEGTKVSGSRELIAAVRSHPQLETIDWP